MKICAIILSAGKSKRFNSDLPKFVHSISGKQLIDFNIEALEKNKNINQIKIITSKTNSHFIESKNKELFIQNPIDGTGGAIKQFYNSNKNFDYYLVLLADTPIFDYKIINNFLSDGIKSKVDISVLSQNANNPSGYGRIILNKDRLIKIVEESDCNADEKNVKLVNTGIFLISKKSIKNVFSLIKNKIKKEYYITDLIDISHKQNLKLKAYINDKSPILGVNNFKELNDLEKISQDIIKSKLINSGVKILHPETVYIETDVQISKDVIIEPNVVIKKGVKILKGTTIKSFSYLENCYVGKNCLIGPFARLRPEAILQDDVKIGNFVEIKNSKLASKVKVNHLSYLGDSTIGKNSNIGAGTITCNFDGKNKFHSKIGDNCFIGTNSSIIAPVNIGNNSYIAAGSVITKNVPKNYFSISRAKQKNLKNFKR
ncbi:MAG: bifunctional UDP-N-acetylglucosamine diphosphorylase/glucosamine-1-phosphate N-acetyltransferase GlmU [Alphaproteobacteria bacterium]|jgi:bifunctional UDP-N-acetylglucosamine pyrophosphorylase/glucosamine-1-phosphate N-acetyltransferase